MLGFFLPHRDRYTHSEHNHFGSSVNLIYGVGGSKWKQIPFQDSRESSTILKTTSRLIKRAGQESSEEVFGWIITNVKRFIASAYLEERMVLCWLAYVPNLNDYTLRLN